MSTHVRSSIILLYLNLYHIELKYSDTASQTSPHNPKILTKFYKLIKCLKGCDQVANRLNPDQTAPETTICLSISVQIFRERMVALIWATGIIISILFTHTNPISIGDA